MSSIPNSRANSPGLMGAVAAKDVRSAIMPRFEVSASFLLEFYWPAGISVVATGLRFALCSKAFALARSLF